MGVNENWTVKSALVLILVGSCLGWGSEKVMLKDVEVLTLKYGAMTAGRRSSPVPQLKCVGGTARCEFTPKVVQCYNRGSDGHDVQWECKTDMDNDYRFGDISVTCEGYDYPDDPYVLKGSCGLEYTIDYTKEGAQRAGGNDYYQQHDRSSDYGWNSNLFKSSKPKSDFITNICCGAVVVVIVYAIYKTCIQPGTNTANARSNTNDDYRGGGPGQAPPPPGFRSDYSQGGSGYSGGTGFDDSCGSSSSSRPRGSAAGGGSGAGGFWTGAAAGGLLGYMFGNRGGYNTGYGGATYRPRPSTSWGGGSSWGSSGGGGGGWGGGSSSSGSRSSSGFGGTSRR